MATSKLQRAATAKRRAEALELRRAGHGLQYIVDQLGYSGVAHVSKDLTRALAANLGDVAESSAALRPLEIERLDALWQHAWMVLKRRHLLVQGGKVVVIEDEETGEEIRVNDDGPALAAIDRLLKIATRRAALLGLDAPTKVTTDGVVRYVIEGVDLDKL